MTSSSTRDLGSLNNSAKQGDNTGAKRAWVKPELQQLSIREALTGVHTVPEGTTTGS